MSPLNCLSGGIRRRHQAGAGLIEVLIAILVVAIGVIGVARIQINMLRANQDAMLRTQASLLAYDMIDRMRADRERALTGAYNRSFGAATPGDGTIPGAAVGTWLTQVAMLPLGDGEIALNGNQLTVRVRWDETRGANEGEVDEEGDPLGTAFSIFSTVTAL
jgi:type IV pilus assembly protein PilV